MIIAVLNQKGGVAKTTTAINLARALSLEGYDVEILDLDQQQDAVAYDELGDDDGHITAKEFHIPGVRTREESPGAVREIDREKPGGFVILDCPPALGDELAVALSVAHLAIVPVNSEYSGLRGLQRVFGAITAAQRAGNHLLQHRVLLTMFDGRAGHCRDIAAAASEKFRGKIFETIIRRSYAFADATQNGMSIIDFSPKNPGAAGYRNLAKEVLLWQQQQLNAAAPARKNVTPARR